MHEAYWQICLHTESLAHTSEHGFECEFHGHDAQVAGACGDKRQNDLGRWAAKHETNSETTLTHACTNGSYASK